MHLLDGEDMCMLSVPCSSSDLHFSCWQSGENCQAVAADAWLRIVVFFQMRVISLLFCLVVFPMRCLLDDSRPFGLTLRPSALVCCCHRDSLTRGRLAFAQEAVRGPPSPSSFGSARDDMRPVISGSLREMSLQALMKNRYWADQHRLQTSDLHFDQFPTPATFACWKIRFKKEVCTCLQFPTEAKHWIKEVEMVYSVGDWKSSFSIRRIRMPNFGVLDARIASALNRIIHNSHFKRRISQEEQKAQKEDRFLRGRQIAYLIYDFFQVTGIHDSVENYADLFTVGFRNDDIQEFDSKWCGILLSMTKIPRDDILEGLYKLRIRESEQLKTVLELYDLEIHQKKAGLDYHRFKTMVKRSIEQDLRMKNFWSQNWKLWEERRGQESRDKTAWTKNSWRLLAMGRQRAVF